MTLEELKQLEKELHDLKTKREENAKKLWAIREEGNLSDNPEYYVVKDEQRAIEARIDEIHQILKTSGT